MINGDDNDDGKKQKKKKKKKKDEEEEGKKHRIFFLRRKERSSSPLASTAGEMVSPKGPKKDCFRVLGCAFGLGPASWTWNTFVIEY